MPHSESTCWTVIRAAAAGNPADREELARRYLGIIRAYLAARWRGSAVLAELGDAVQEVFVECFRHGGALEAVGAGRVPSFRAYLYGVVRNVARRFETPTAHTVGPLPDEIGADEVSQSRLFDRAWAKAIMAEAAQLQRHRAMERGTEAVRRVELLQLRFQENLPIRAIAERWGIDAATLHHAYALARKEFRAALLEVLAFHSPSGPEALEREAGDLLKALA
jgi:RNA polymerase sigma-70 factor (ECF subfamily)